MALKPIAIVGISAEFPSGAYSTQNLNYDDFSKFLLSKGESYEKVPKDRFDIERWHGQGLGRTITQKGSFLKDVTLFDHVEFGITSKDAKNMSLGTRKLVEHAFLALLDSGINYRGRNVGCYMSATAFDIHGVSEPDELEAIGSFSGYPNAVANKVSYHLDLRGPSIPTDTACSSSLSALHLAVQAIRSGDCSAAVIGGCQLNFRLIDFILYSQGSILSADGKCKPLDESANGFSRGEGATVIVLKLLEEAIRDNDYIYGSILGTGINSSGSLAPTSAPVASAQQEAMKRAFKDTGRTPSEVDYVELHATGTSAGDPVEANWVGQVFGQRDSELLVGSVKGNIGHLEICAFLASLCKVCAMFQTRLLPPTVNLSKPNPAIAWGRWNMRAPTEVLSIAGGKNQLLVSIASSGIGGANGHALVESFSPAQPLQISQPAHEHPLLIMTGGLSPRSATEMGNSIDSAWKDSSLGDLPVLSSIWSRRGRQMPWQTFSIKSNYASVVPFAKPTLLPKSIPGLVFVFSGQGPQYILMGSQLFESYPAFRNSILGMDVVYEKIVGHSIRSLGLFSSGSTDKWGIWPITVTLPAIAMVQMAIYDLLSSIGIVPRAVVGHSAGETAMMYASGACSRDMALEISIARSRALGTLECLGGSMVALGCGPDEAQAIIDDVLANQTGILQIACHNSDSAVTVSGAEPLLDSVVALAKSRDISAHKLRTKVAVHSDFVEQCKATYYQQVEDIFTRYPGHHVPLVSTYSSTFGTIWSGPFTPDYYWCNARQPVLFSQAINMIIKDHPEVGFVEISPHPVLSTYICDAGVEQERVLCFMRRTRDPHPSSEPIMFLRGIAKLSLLGYTDIDFHSLNNTRASSKDRSISYPFQRKYVPFRPEPPKSTMYARSNEWSGPLLHTGLRLNAATHPKLAEHVIMGEPILPAAGFLEMVFESGAQLAWNIRFHSMLSLSSERPLPVSFTVNGPSWSVSSELQSHPYSKKRIHAEGYMSSTAVLDSRKLSISDLKRNLQQVDISGLYSVLNHFSRYGPVFQRVNACWRSNTEALVEIRAYDADLEDLDKYVIHPALLDACFHIVVHPMFTANADRSVYYLPTSVETVTVHDPWFIRQTLPKIVYSHVAYKSWDPAGITFDLSVADASGNIICQLLGFRIAKHKKTSTVEFEHQVQFDSRYEIVYQPLLTSTPYTLSQPKVVALPVQFQSNHAIASMELQSTDGKKPIDSVENILRFLRTQVGLSVIRVLSVGSEPLKLLRALTESNFLYQSILHLDVLVKRESLTEVPLKGVGRIIQSVHAQEGRNGNDTSFYDVVLVHEDGSDTAALQHIVQRLLPGGFLILTTDDVDLDASLTATDCSPNSHVIFQNKLTTGLLTACTAAVSSGQVKASDAFSTCEEPVRVIGQELSPTKTIIKSFPFNDVLSLQQTIQALSENETLWIESPQDANGYAATGLVRSLQHEMVTKDIRLALFDVKWSPEERTAMVSSFSSYPYIEKEVLVDSFGVIRVPRLVPSSILVTGTSWYDQARNSTGRNIGDGPASHPSPVFKYRLSPSHAQVHVISSSSECVGHKAVIGYVLDAGTTTWAQGTYVVCTTRDLIANAESVAVHEHSLLEYTHFGSHSPSAISGGAMTVFIAALAIGSRTLARPDALGNLRVSVTRNGPEDEISLSLSALLTLLGITVTTISKPITPEVLSGIRSSDVVLTGWSNPSDIETITSLLPESATFLSWNAPQADVVNLLKRNTWMVGDILHGTRDILHHFLSHQESQTEDGIAPVESQTKSQPTSTSDSLFDASKEYYLIGGIGSLGVRAALWMYENGARMLVLTSRRGDSSSLAKSGDEMAIRMLLYLQNRMDLRIRLEACDASSVPEMTALFRRADAPIGGAILASVVLADKLFVAYDKSSYCAPFPGKIGALVALERAIDIKSLDFLVSISSVSALGNVGQTNYASANTAVDGLLSKYTNAFSIMSPAIIDSTIMSTGLDLSPDPRYKGWLECAMTCSELLECVGDGIRVIANKRMSLYVPRLNWYYMKKHLGPSPIYNHLVYEPTQNKEEASTNSADVLIPAIIMKLLDIEQDDFSPDIPLTSYGLDSLSAGRLSHSLKPFLQISQLQLLADVSLEDIQRRIEDNKKANVPTEVPETAQNSDFDWAALNQPGQTLVKLVGGDGVPLIVVHGVNGNIVPFIPLQEQFTTPLWAIQLTPDCPTDSMQALAAFYLMQIKTARPSGPYRIGGYSAGTLLAFEIAYLLHASGDQVLQMVVFDFFPTILTAPHFQPDHETIETRKASHAMQTTLIELLLGTYSRESKVSHQRIATELKGAWAGEEVPQLAQDYVAGVSKMATMFAKFLIDLCFIERADQVPSQEIYRILREWSMRVDLPLVIAIAEHGLFESLPEPTDQWTNLAWTGASIINLPSCGHYSMLESPVLVDALQDGWRAKEESP
ncbi:polyketide synthase [Hypholoma sublateritium FD-334 SS-4]|uniref:Polyketide synthase n=1 Tax=Hypholoma sublateritium (strain FD-334 SS-4) TaxID=945553 RepID=A0A0D2P4W7_HYPSF|nr:polyketide synthase [Hypholoma sublateritium FD-334 SS-4]